VQNKILSILIAFLLGISISGFAQVSADSSNTQGKDSSRLQLKKVWTYSLMAPGFGQIYNKQYWKLPISYGSIGSFAYLGWKENKNFQTIKSDYTSLIANPDIEVDLDQYRIDTLKSIQLRNNYYKGMGVFIWATVLDAVVNYETDGHLPAKATIYSTMMPGLGQIYNKQYWKVPIIYAALSGSWYMASSNNYKYQKVLTSLRNYNATNEDIIINGQVKDKDTAIRYKDYVRRNRDISYLVFGLTYVLQILDANVDANMLDYDISDDLSFHIEPVYFNNPTNPYSITSSTVGLGLNFNF